MAFAFMKALPHRLETRAARASILKSWKGSTFTFPL
jgi:hypothetical protein